MVGEPKPIEHIPNDVMARLHRFVAFIFVLAMLGAVTWLARDFILLRATALWIVSDPISRADAIVVLGGGLETRPSRAAELWRKGLADKILVSQTMRTVSGSGTPSDTEINHLLRLGVPADAIETFGTANTNTREEAVALRRWAERNSASVFIVPTEIFPARRVRWIFRRVFLDTTVRVIVSSSEPPHYRHYNWWRSEKGSTALRTELLKYIYYLLRY